MRSSRAAQFLLLFGFCLLWVINVARADMSIQFPSVNDLPVIAGMPDPLIGANGKQITGVASEQSFTAAQPVYAWLKVPSNIGFNYRPGGHMLAPDDWSAILDFADLHFRSIKTDRSFDTLPAPDQFH